MINLDYAFHHLECAVRIMAGRREALDDMDISADGFWRSFSAIAVALPAMFFVWVVSARQTQATLPTHSTGGLIAAEATFELVMWLLPVLVLAVVLRPLGLSHRFSHLIIARNWSGAVVSYAVAAVFLPQLVLSPENGFVLVLYILLLMALVLFAVRITSAALDTGLATASAFVAAELIAGLMLASLYYGALGLSGPS